MTSEGFTPTDRKRSRADDDSTEQTPSSIKKRKAGIIGERDSLSTPRALNAVESAVANINVQSLRLSQPNPLKTDKGNVANGVSPKTESAKGDSASKARPAIKLAALKGTIWDNGEIKSPSPKKAASGRSPGTKQKGRVTPAKSPLGRPRKSTLGVDADESDTINVHTPTKSRSVKGSKIVNLSTLEGDAGSDEESVHGTPGVNRFASKLIDSSKASRGILTPTKSKTPRPQKSVTFGERTSREVFFEDLRKTAVPAKKQRAARKPKEEDAEEIRCEICSKGHSKPPNEIILCDNCDFAVHQDCYGVSEIPEGDWLCKSCDQEDVIKALNTTSDRDALMSGTCAPEIPNFERHLRSVQRVLLERCAGRRRIQLFGQQEVYDKARQVVEQTVVSGEGNSMLLIGARGSGKTTLVENVVADLSKEHGHDFHVVRLSGFIHTDDKLALKDIWRQLGKEMEVEDDLVSRSNYADTMTSLLALLSHPSEIMGTEEGITSQSVVFVIDEFDLFAAHPRQTLLYNLFDIAQSRKAPVAVVGCTTRLDVVEMLEKRVKSRFSHRYVYLSLPRSLPAYWQICRQGLMIDKVDASKEGIDITLEGWDEFRAFWLHKIEELYKQPSFQEMLQFHYYTTKSAAAFFSEWLLPLATLSPVNLELEAHTPCSEATSLAPPDSRMQLLQSLSELDLSLLIAAARLDITAHTDTINFAMVYDEYASLVGRQRVQSATSGMLAVGGGVRVWSRGVAGIAFERLISLGLLVPSGLGAGRGSGGGLDSKMWKVELALEEIPTAVKLNNVLAKWCREI